MKIVKLNPSTARMRQLIKAHGTHWQIVPVAPVAQLAGNWLFIESMDGEHTRWVPLAGLTEINHNQGE